MECRGGTRFYSFREVVLLRVAKELARGKHVVAIIAEARRAYTLLVEARLVVSGGAVPLVRGREELVSVMRAPGQGVLQFVLDLRRVVGELRKGEKRLRY